MIKDKLIPIVFVLIVALFLVSGCTLPFSKSSGNVTTPTKEKTQAAPSTEEQTPENTPENLTEPTAASENKTQPEQQAPSSSLLDLDIRINPTYVVDEKVNGEYYIKYTGSPFKGLVMYTYPNQGAYSPGVSYAPDLRAVLSGTFNDIDFDNPDKRGMMDMTLQVPGGDHFTNPGTYSYSMAVYDCFTVESELNKDCNKATLDELEGIQPLKQVSKTVVVTGESAPRECSDDSQCTKTCDGCILGHQLCEQTNSKCMDCINRFNCKDGYKCNDGFDLDCIPGIDCTPEQMATINNQCVPK